MWILLVLICSVASGLGMMNRGGGGQGGGKGGKGGGGGGGRGGQGGGGGGRGGQGGGGGRGGQGGGKGAGAGGGGGGRKNGKGFPPPQIFMLMQNASVHEELKLNEDQKTAAVAAMKPVRAQYREESSGFADLQPKQRRQKNQELAAKITQASYDALGKTLEEAQYKRLLEIELQALGVRGLLSPRTISALTLSADQQAKLQALVEELGRKAQKVTRGSTPGDAATRDQMATLRKEALQQGTALLTADQQKTWKSIIGTPFQIRMEPRPQRDQANKPTEQADPFSFDDDDL